MNTKINKRTKQKKLLNIKYELQNMRNKLQNTYINKIQNTLDFLKMEINNII